jgi:hypothetical protein
MRHWRHHITKRRYFVLPAIDLFKSLDLQKPRPTFRQAGLFLWILAVPMKKTALRLETYIASLYDWHLFISQIGPIAQLVRAEDS